MTPAVGSTSRLIERRNVVLPAPLLPRMTTNSPARTARSIPRRATVAGGRTTESPATSIIGSMRIVGSVSCSAGADAEQVHRRPNGVILAVLGGREPVDLVESLEQGSVGGAVDVEEGGADPGEGRRVEPGAGADPRFGDRWGLRYPRDPLAFDRVGEVLLPRQVERGDGVHVAVQQRAHRRVVGAGEDHLAEKGLRVTVLNEPPLDQEHHRVDVARRAGRIHEGDRLAPKVLELPETGVSTHEDARRERALPVP